MLQTIGDVLISIGDFFSNVAEFIVSFVSDLIGFVGNLLEMSTIFTLMMQGVFPTYFLSGVLGLVGVMVLLRVLGRD